MNQILVTEKLYITPELKKKKQFYRVEFFISVFLICVLFSYYIYAEYDKVKSEEMSKEILANTTIEKVEEVDRTIKDELLVVILDDEEIEREVVEAEYTQTTTQPTPVQDITEREREQNSAIPHEERKTNSGIKYTVCAIVNIPKINVNYSVLGIKDKPRSMTETQALEELLKMSPCRFWGADQDGGVFDANKVGNFCIVGHNYRNTKFFSKVPTLGNGDIIEVTDTKGKTIKYMVYSKYVVSPEDKSCTSQHTNGKKEITLITCTNDSKERWIIKATEVL